MKRPVGDNIMNHSLVSSQCSSTSGNVLIAIRMISPICPAVLYGGECSILSNLMSSQH